MPLPTFKTLFDNADNRSTPAGVAAAGGNDATVLEALSQAVKRGWVKPIVTGSRSEIESTASANNIVLDDFEIIESDSPAVAAVEAVHDGRAQLLMKGQIDTPSLMKAVFNKENGLRTGKTVCQMILMEVPKDNKTFLLSDTGITISPTLEQKEEIVLHAIETAKQLGSASPKIALMSATEKVNDALPDTLDSKELTTRCENGNYGECSVQGPLSFDLAYATVAGSRKKIDGDVVGNCDAMIFPDLLTGNLVVKAIMYTADCQFGGILCGTTAPVVFMSRADSTETRMNSLAYALSVLEK